MEPRLSDIDELVATLPSDRNGFVDEVLEVASRDVHLPAMLRDHHSVTKDFPKGFTIKRLPEFARSMAGHFEPLRAAGIAAGKGSGAPAWLRATDAMLAEPGSKLVDRTLGIVIALRESGPLVHRTSSPREKVDSFLRGGLDNLFSNRASYLAVKLVPKAWVDELTKGATSHSAMVVQERLMGFYLARIGLARRHLVHAIADEFFGKSDADAEERAEAAFIALTGIERKIWLALAFAAAGGQTKDLATVSPGNTGVRTILRAFHLGNVRLGEIVDVPRAALGRRAFSPEVLAVLKPEPAGHREAMRFLTRLQGFFRLNIAVKTAVVAHAMDLHHMSSKVSKALPIGGP